VIGQRVQVLVAVDAVRPSPAPRGPPRLPAGVEAVRDDYFTTTEADAGLYERQRAQDDYDPPDVDHDEPARPTAEGCPSCRIGLWHPGHVHYTHVEHRAHVAHNQAGVEDDPACPMCAREQS